jgi:hypothetical protein
MVSKGSAVFGGHMPEIPRRFNWEFPEQSGYIITIGTGALMTSMSPIFLILSAPVFFALAKSTKAGPSINFCVSLNPGNSRSWMPHARIP